MSNRKNPVRFTVDFAGKKIIGTVTSLHKAKHPGSDEYRELCSLIEAHPGFAIEAKKIKSKSDKSTYKNLTFKVIEKYISTLPDADQLLAEYRHVKQMAKELNLGVYPFTKHWFLSKFSTEDKPLDMEEVMKAIGAVIPEEIAAIESTETREEIKETGLTAMQTVAA